jgi:hypothetical protein
MKNMGQRSMNARSSSVNAVRTVTCSSRIQDAQQHVERRQQAQLATRPLELQLGLLKRKLGHCHCAILSHRLAESLDALDFVHGLSSEIRFPASGT